MSEKSVSPTKASVLRWSRRALIGGGIACAAAAAGGIGVLASRDGAGLVKGRSRARAVVGDSQLPDAVDVVVIGGGNIGCMTALTLAERGLKVALFEKGVVAGESSGRSMGFVDGSLADPVKLPLLERSAKLWSELNHRVGGETGYRRSGLVMAASSPDTLGFTEQWIDAVKGMPGADARILTARETSALLPGSNSDDYVGGFYAPSDGKAEAQLFAPAVADAFRRNGGKLYQGCAVRGLDRRNGRISAVVTEKGRVKCSTVVIAGGVWSPVLLRSLGVELPQLMGFSSNARVAATGKSGPDLCFISEKRGIIARRALNGAYDTAIAVATAPVLPGTLRYLPQLLQAYQNLGDQIRPALNLSTFMWNWNIPDHWELDAVSPFEERRILVPETREAIVRDSVRGLAEGFPSIGRAPVIEQWAGALTSTLDNMPVISDVAGNPGLYVGSGFYFGMTMAPAAGEALADLVMGRKPQFDLAPYRLGRFSDGSDLIFRS